MIAPRYHKHFYSSGYSGFLSTEVMDVINQWYEPENLILDLGCGTGWDTLELVEHGYRVLAVDSHRPMIEQLKYKIVNHGVQDKVCGFTVDLESPRPYHRIRLDMKERQPHWQNFADGIYAGMGVLQTISTLTNLGAWMFKAVQPNGLVTLVLLNPTSYSIFSRQVKSRSQLGPWNRRRGEAGLNTNHSRAIKWMGGPADLAAVWNPWFELVDVKPAGEGLPPFEMITSSTKIEQRVPQRSAVQRVLNRKSPAQYADWLIVMFKRRPGRSSMQVVEAEEVYSA